MRDLQIFGFSIFEDLLPAVKKGGRISDCDKGTGALFLKEYAKARLVK